MYMDGVHSLLSGKNGAKPIQWRAEQERGKMVTYGGRAQYSNQDAYVARGEITARKGTKGIEGRSKPIVEDSNALANKREPATNAHNVSKKANDAVSELDILKLLNFMEQLSIAPGPAGQNVPVTLDTTGKQQIQGWSPGDIQFRTKRPNPSHEVAAADKTPISA
ncbi:hypothetical protein F5887DRAFT_1161284 [Amanita rubescens]|nr:hypothetical protein F5887DRAFT_1161284 [Amanita rubescens]